MYWFPFHANWQTHTKHMYMNEYLLVPVKRKPRSTKLAQDITLLSFGVNSATVSQVVISSNMNSTQIKTSNAAIISNFYLLILLVVWEKGDATHCILCRTTWKKKKKHDWRPSSTATSLKFGEYNLLPYFPIRKLFSIYFEVSMKWKSSWADMKGVSKWRRMVFFFSWYLFLFQRYSQFCIVQIR